jgi:hypothetical protein
LASPFESDYNHGGSIALAAQSGRVKFPEDVKGYVIRNLWGDNSIY